MKACAAVLALSACGGGGGGDDVVVEPPNFSIGLTTSPGTITIPVGGSATVALSVARGGNYGGTVSFSAEGLPSYVTASFDPPSIGGNATQSTLTLTATSDADAGVYSITVRASGSEVADAQATLNCNVQLIPDFFISTPFPTLTVERGSTIQTVVTIDRRGEFNGAVSLALAGAPAGVTGTFAPNPISGTSSNLTIAAGAAVAAGSYPLTIRGTATGMEDRTTLLTLDVSAAGGYALAISPTTVTLPAPGSATATVTINRSAGFTAPVHLWPEFFPSGVSISGSQNPVTGNTSTYMFTASAQVVPGTYAVSIRGEATGQPERRVTFQLVVQAGAGFSIAPIGASVTLLAGGQAQMVAYTIARGGGFTGSVAFSISGLPTGLTGTFTPATTSGTQTTLSLSAASGVAAQSFAAIVHATAAGVPEQTASVAVHVVTASSTIVWRFCGATPPPVFLAYQDGSAPYVAVTAAGDGTFSTPFASGRGAVAFVLPVFEPPVTDRRRHPFMRDATRAAITAATGYTTHVYYGSTSDLQNVAGEQCEPAEARKTLYGSVTNVPDNEGFGVILGTSVALGLPGEARTFTLLDVPEGSRDLIAARLAVAETTSGDVSLTPTKFIARRSVNAPNGSTLPLLDFASTEAFDPVSALLTLSGLDGATAELSSAFATANGTFSPVSIDFISSNAARTYYGFPSARLMGGDLHAVLASDDRNREVLAFRRDVVPWTVAFGPTIPPAHVDVYATSPVVRLRAQISVGRATLEYGSYLEASFVQAGAQRAIIMHFAESALATSPNYELRTPVFTGLAGWDEGLFGVRLGSPVDWSLEALNNATFIPADGAVLRSVSFTGRLTP